MKFEQFSVSNEIGMSSGNQTVNATTTGASSSTAPARPVRAAAAEGVDARRATAAAYRALDRDLRAGMGSSAGYYSTTKAGEPRKEYYGR